MSKSLAVINGDLALGSGRAFQTVSGRDKLLQDLKLWVLERIGTDRSFPGIGTTFDGGVIEGKQVPSMIGENATPTTIGNIRNEVINLIQLYQQLQFQKLKTETINYNGRNTFEPGELVESIDEVTVVNLDPTSYLVRVILTTVDSNTASITFPIG